MSHRLGVDYSIAERLKQEQLDEELEQEDVLTANLKRKKVFEREDEYHKKRLKSLKKGNNENKNHSKEIEMTVDDGTAIAKRARFDVRAYRAPEGSSELIRPLESDSNLITSNLRFLKPFDEKHFALVLTKKDKSLLSKEELQSWRVLDLLLKIKNGAQSSRKIAMRTLTDKATEFGPQLLFDKILPILLDESLEDQERHLMVKVINRVLFELGDMVQPFVKNILEVTGPLLIDEDSVARSTGTEVISTLSVAAGLSSILRTIRPDVENDDEYIRNLCARIIAVVGKTLGLSKIIPFVHAVAQYKKSWKARHTGVRMIQQIGITMGNSILQHLGSLVGCVLQNLNDDHVTVRIAAANALTVLAQNAYPYGMESFNSTLEPLWKGLQSQRGKVLAAFLKSMGSLIPLMSDEYSGYYTNEVMRLVKRHFNSPDDDMRKTVLTVLQNCSKSDSITSKFLTEEIAVDFFKQFWTRRVALDKQFNKLVVHTTIVIAEKLGCSLVVDNLLKPLRDEAEPFRIMAVHAINKVVENLGTNDLTDRQEERLIDALLIAFQEQTSNDAKIGECFGTVATSLDKRMAPFLSPIISTILNHFKHKSPAVRENAADLCATLIPVIASCEEFEILIKLNVILYESLGEIYPETLGSIINAMHQIVDYSSLERLQPPINQILPTLTPILKNTHRKVQVNTINFIGEIADCGPEYVPPKEWMRICFELLELLKSTNKSIRRAANDTFGYLAKAIGPNDILAALLNNLKVQERQLRVCTAVAIGIVAKVCGPYTVIPALMNEYKTPETNVQNGVLKAMAFVFEDIGRLSQDYLYFLIPLLEDALTDRDLVHRQTAAEVTKHIALNCAGSGLEDAFIHLLNLLVPNIFETSPHVIIRILDSLESLSIAIGPGVMMNYLWAGLFHPAQKVRKAFWKLHNRIYISSTDAIVPHYPIKVLDIDELNVIL